MTGRVNLDTARLDFLIKSLDPRVVQIVDEAAFAVLAGAQTRAPRDTGALANSLNVQETGWAKRRVQDAVEYGIHQEFGTHKMAAQPFMVPAVEAERMNFNQRFMDLVR